ncbi:hypothetical protein PF005_g16474 [Phytophthora fragariae]|nr:hypothetical protein PF003_g33799 [Phytophthora fragariae]KAE8946293.1 hypothetical protein PF009_g4074 [Phytophthora fragariae]KAE9130556.1 hypothetical protein PF006_g15735 [Phytophthora fragariae]KAE9197550.1 hypothetical protein PF005_g16474 [Phytophthora fragariae]KAE9253747.1 hypothetical protein PF002_g3179 [Phytophthora fragariae]
MSDYVLIRVRRQWDQFMMHKSGMACEKKDGCIWDVFARRRTFTCDDTAWTCNCAFYTSQNLPCQHLMFVAGEGHGFAELPPFALHDRWNMEIAASFVEKISDGVLAVGPILNIARLRKRHNGNPSSNAIRSVHPQYASKTSQVAFARLQRNDRSSRVVLTHAETYNLARSLFDPVIDRLSRLSSNKFYEQLQLWDDVVNKATREIQACSDAHPTGFDDEEDGPRDEEHSIEHTSDFACIPDADDFFIDPLDWLEIDDDSLHANAARQGPWWLDPDFPDTALAPSTTSSLPPVKLSPATLSPATLSSATLSPVTLATTTLNPRVAIPGREDSEQSVSHSAQDPDAGSCLPLIVAADGTSETSLCQQECNTQVSSVRLVGDKAKRVIDDMNLPPHSEGKT